MKSAWQIAWSDLAEDGPQTEASETGKNPTCFRRKKQANAKDKAIGNGYQARCLAGKRVREILRT
ncbi:uncharacterized protein FOMMEDRAFT_158423 [Fomitiporia mediterranea MF3/22]|uniref:uncharacterized protein n=1 Tax=Fomitiporia mediterranea (strain MF3/22) TaxID=694068 RepID=UPI00044082F2|nr:uncharacterized protein FOMMEDRAFT_158423 [Fomitiporia mediterranea MF3/22]EJD01289.1 hypothetical protein FOMMEDRAFT_158423 [Fomitiporia mediterranea MF3/22]